MSEYKVYLDGVLMPLGIDELSTEIKNRNDDVELINGKVKSLPKYPGLTTWKFKVFLPTGFYRGDRKIQPPDYYLDLFEKLKLDKKVFRFIVQRSESLDKKSKNYTNFGLAETNVAVTLEDYKRLESSDLALNSEVAITLRQYAEYEAIKVSISKSKDKEYIDPNDEDNPDNPVDPEDPEKPIEPEPKPEPETEPEYMVIVKEELKRLEGKKLPETYKVGFIKKQSQSGSYVNYYMTWKDVSKELFGSDKYWRGIRDTNPGKGNPEVNKEQPPELYPRHRTTLNIDKEAIVTIIAAKYPEDLE